MKALELMVSKIQPQGDASEDKEHRKPAPSRRTIHGVYTAILFMAKASFPGFTHSTFDRERVLNKLDTLVKQKKLVRGTWSERQVISVRLLIRLTSAFISHALIHGCLNFDSVTSRMLAIVLVAAGRRRAGDITRSRLYTNEVGMTWSDIELKLVGGSDYQHLRCKVTVRFAKGKKYVDSPSCHSSTSNTNHRSLGISGMTTRCSTYNHSTNPSRTVRARSPSCSFTLYGMAW